MNKVFILISKKKLLEYSNSNSIEGVFSNKEKAIVKMNNLIQKNPYKLYNIFGPYIIDNDIKDNTNMNMNISNNILNDPNLKIPELKKDIPEISNPNLNIDFKQLTKKKNFGLDD
jgi:hypothetical protein